MGLSAGPVQCVWFKRDLRVHDHGPLTEACGLGPVLAVFLVEEEVRNAPDFDGLHAGFLREALVDLRRSLEERGIVLVVRSGEAVAALEELRRETNFRTLWSHEETGNAITFRRDRRVASWARERGVAWREWPQSGVVRGLRDRDGWSRIWNRRMRRQPLPPPPPAEGSVGEVRSDPLPPPSSLSDDDWERQPDLRGGESKGLGVLRSFAGGRGRGYRTAMSSPTSAFERCSRLSPYLAWGCVSLSRAVAEVEAAAGKTLPKADASSFLSRCRWHCHFVQKLESEPEIERRCFNRACEDLRPETPDGRFLAAWQSGRTGYPFLDACMRALRTRGWINFRMRAMLVSFAAYDLWLDWRHFRDFLARQFIDYEPGIHVSQIQMQSGVTGINTLRIYNPVKQGKDFDPDGAFVRAWVPELARLDADTVHEPWAAPAGRLREAGVRLGRDYPLPVVDHAEAVRAARARFQALRRTDGFWREAERVRERHGSRKSAENRNRPRRPASRPDPQGQLELG